MSDHYLAPAPGTKAAMCAVCKQIKPLAEFKRDLSRAQARARGYSGNASVEIESSMCKLCQPRAKPLRELTAKEIHNRVSAGDLYAPWGTEELRRRSRKANINRRMAASAAWKAAKTKPWGEVIGGLRSELAAIQQQEKHAKKTRPGMDLTFFLEYKLLLTQLRERMKFDCNAKGIAPKFLDWEPHVTWEERIRMKRLWETLPGEYRQRARLPGLATWVPPAKDRVPPKVSSLAKDGSPKARLERVKAMREAGVPMPPPPPIIHVPEIPLPSMPETDPNWLDDLTAGL